MTVERPRAFVSTGQLPPPERVRMLVDDAHQRFPSIDDGQPSQIYPALAQESPELFGICVVGARGGVYGVGDDDVEFTIMSVAKPFVFALICAALGPEDVAQNRAECHGFAVQFTDGHRTRRRGSDEPNGERL